MKKLTSEREFSEKIITNTFTLDILYVLLCIVYSMNFRIFKFLFNV